ncbi:MAG: ABC-F family ATP-binding cassette domain-containing protein [Eubacteriales bacterium]|nr:ABC-F family ATP-binding cassette domain-containing protein [Eubacteriales bacterium]
MNLLTMNNFSKSYTDRMLFDRASFHVQEGEKVGVIGANGMGKSTLLKMITGEEAPDEGELVMANYAKVAYLKQTPVFSDEQTVLDAVMQKLDCKDASLVAEAKAMLGRLGITDYVFPISHMSGGEQKRVALVNALLLPVDLLVLDEPTNHLDHEMSRWLEDYLLSYKGAVVMVTHDRYFLDRVVDRIVEVERGQIYSYIGTYAEYVGQKLKQRNKAVSAEKKRQNILRKELAWLGRGARARSTKQKAHIQRIEELMNIAGPVAEETVMMSSVASRMGGKTIELSHLSKRFGNRVIVSDFSYHFLRDDRIGIVGSNGSGKSTLLKMIVGDILPDQGVIEIGETIRIGYFAQTNVHMDEEMKAIDYVREVADYIQTEDGKITASALMERFLFDGTLQWSKIGKLSGGERRRLFLMRILMQAPNVLIFDEPTNDLDIHTLNVLEDYLDQFRGILMIVSHDRYFLDRVVNRIFAFEGDGQICRYEGNYSDYLIERAERYPDKYNRDGSLIAWSARKDKVYAKAERNAGKSWKTQNPNEKLKFSYNEQREYDTIDADIECLEQALEKISQSMEANATNSVKLKELLEEQERLSKELDNKMERWVYLNDLAEKIAAKNRLID